MRLLSILNEDFKYIGLNELYFGKKPVMKLKTCFDNFFIFCKNNPNKLPYRDKTYTDLINETKRVFGFNDFKILIEVNLTSMCASYAVNINTDKVSEIPFYLINSQYGFRFNKIYKFKAVTTMSKGIFNNMTSDTAFAVYLHEIGHSFESVIRYGAAKVETDIMDMSVDIESSYRQYYSNTYVVEDIIRYVNKVIYNDTEAKYASDSYNQDTQAKRDKRNIDYKNKFFEITKSGLLSTIKAVTSFFKGNSRSNDGNDINSSYRGNEYFCDSFAVMYGYGAEINSANLGNIYNDNSFMMAYIDFLSMPSNILNSGSHPSDITRYKSILNHLQFELKNNKSLTSEDKNDILNTINSIDSKVAEYMKSMAGSRCDTIRKITSILIDWVFGKRIAKNMKDVDYNFGINIK